MEKIFTLDKILSTLEGSNKILFMVGVMLLAFIPILSFVKKFINPSIEWIINIKGSTYANILRKYKLNSYFVQLFVSFYLFFWSEIFEQAGLLSPLLIYIKNFILTVYSTIFVSAILITSINIFVDIYKTKEISSRIPIGLHAHILKILISTSALLIILSHSLNLDLSTLLTSLGAAAALLTFIFKDTLLGLIASLQLTFQDIIKVGDWITVPGYNADGTVEAITITVVKVRNFDNTIVALPTHALISGGVQNWQAMHRAGGRRIKRSVYIDIATIKLCDQSWLEKIGKKAYLSGFFNEHRELLQAEKMLVNLTIFRHYLTYYLNNHQSIHKDNYFIMVRQMQPTPTGLPLEIYAYTKNTDLLIHERIQSDIFDHIFAIMPEFELKAFQTLYQPTIEAKF